MGLLDNDPYVQYRGTILPLLNRAVTDPYDDISEYEQTELAVPGLLYEPVRSMALAGGMLTGRVPYDERIITQAALDAPVLGGLLGTATRTLPEGQVLGAFVGSRAKSANKQALDQAILMRDRGASRDEIWNETGWFKDVDNNWKFEIDDSKSDINWITDVSGPPTKKSSDVLVHDELYAAYPAPEMSYQQLKDEMGKIKNTVDYYRVTQQSSGKQGYDKFTPKMAKDLPLLEERYKDLGRQRRNFEAGLADIPTYGGFSVDTLGSYLPATDAIYNYLPRKTRPKEFRSTQLHELQHAIQQREGFAKGGMPSQMKNKVINPQWTAWNKNKDVVEEMKAIKFSPEYQQQLRHMNNVWKEKYAPKLEMLEAKELKAKSAVEREKYYPLIDKIFDDFKKEEQLAPNYSRLVSLVKKHGLNPNKLDGPPKYLDADEAYKRLAGEAEARNVQTRIDFTPEERAAKPPWTTLDVPENELFVQFNANASPSPSLLIDRRSRPNTSLLPTPSYPVVDDFGTVLYNATTPDGYI